MREDDASASETGRDGDPQQALRRESLGAAGEWRAGARAAGSKRREGGAATG